MLGERWPLSDLTHNLVCLSITRPSLLLVEKLMPGLEYLVPAFNHVLSGVSIFIDTSFLLDPSTKLKLPFGLACEEVTCSC